MAKPIHLAPCTKYEFPDLENSVHGHQIEFNEQVKYHNNMSVHEASLSRSTVLQWSDS